MNTPAGLAAQRLTGCFSVGEYSTPQNYTELHRTILGYRHRNFARVRALTWWGHQEGSMTSMLLWTFGAVAYAAAATAAALIVATQ